MLHNFETIFRPEPAKHPGYIDVKMLKLRTALQGSAPAGVNYRFSLTYRSEELRQKWVSCTSRTQPSRQLIPTSADGGWQHLPVALGYLIVASIVALMTEPRTLRRPSPALTRSATGAGQDSAG